MRPVLAGLLAAAALLAGCQGETTAPVRTSAPPPATAAPTPTATPTPAGRPGAHALAVTPVVSTGPRDRPRVALTFDADMTSGMLAKLRDGRVTSYYNADLIAQLRLLQVPATLFLTGLWMERYPEVTRELAADPLFELGTHSYDHRDFVTGCTEMSMVPRAEMAANVRQAVVLLASLDPDATRWFRFPGACLDEAALRAIAPAGVTAVQYDVAGADGDAPSAQWIADRVVRAARNGSIVVLHMHGGRAAYTDEALPAMVAGLRRRGFELVTVTRLLAP